MYRNRGVGALLVKQLLKVVKPFNYKQIYLCTGNDSRVNFYQGLGFNVIKQLRQQGAGKVIMQQALDNSN